MKKRNKKGANHIFQSMIVMLSYIIFSEKRNQRMDRLCNENNKLSKYTQFSCGNYYRNIKFFWCGNIDVESSRNHVGGRFMQRVHLMSNEHKKHTSSQLNYLEKRQRTFDFFFILLILTHWYTLDKAVRLFFLRFFPFSIHVSSLRAWYMYERMKRKAKRKYLLISYISPSFDARPRLSDFPQFFCSFFSSFVLQRLKLWRNIFISFLWH